MNEVETVRAQLLKEIDSVSDDMGIYPQAVTCQDKEKSYTERDGFKNGWNAAVMQYVHKVQEVLGCYQSPWLGPEQAFASDDGTFIKLDGKWGVCVSDTWYYACADFEEIPEDEYDEVLRLYQSYGSGGAYFWVFLKRNHMSEHPVAKKQVEAVRDVEAFRINWNAERAARRAAAKAS